VGLADLEIRATPSWPVILPLKLVDAKNRLRWAKKGDGLDGSANAKPQIPHT
jgi:hypothetical protein